MSFNTSSDTSSNFEWDEYLLKTNGHAADENCFKQSIVPPPNNFEVGSLLEAEDQRSTALEIQNVPSYVGEGVRSRSSISGTPLDANRRTSLTAAPVGTLRRFRAAAFSLARVVEVWGARIRVRLVGTDDRNDCWFLVDSDQIRPYPSGNLLQPPFGYMHNHLVWDRTLKKATEGAKFADDSWFIKPPPDPAGNCFQVGDKLEAIDRRNAQLICPATVGEVNGHFIMVRFDGWSGAFDYWTRFDSRELFPVGWCKKAEYPLQSPGPNALRSPTTHSTPAQSSRLVTSSQLNSLTDLVNQPSTPYARFPKRSVDDKWNPRFKLPRRPRTRRPRTTMKPRRLANVKRFMKIEPPVNEDYLRPTEQKRKRKVYTRHKALVPGRSEHASPSTVIGLPPPALSDDSADWSARSLSSPPLIHREEEDEEEIQQSGNYSLVNRISSNSDNYPPRIVDTGCTSRDRKVSGPGSGEACVVRLQARSTATIVPPFSTSNADILQRINSRDGSIVVSPELKSWQVVTNTIGTDYTVESRSKNHRKTSKRHKRYTAEREANKLHKKLKLVNHHHTSDNTLGKPSPSEITVHQSSGASQQTNSNFRSSFSNIDVTQTATHNLESTVDALAKMPLGSPSGHQLSTSSLSFYNCPPSMQVPLHLCCDDCHPGTTGSAELGGFPLMHSVAGKTCCMQGSYCRRDLMLAHEYSDKLVEEVRDSAGSCPENSGSFSNHPHVVVGSGWSSTAPNAGASTRLTRGPDSMEHASSDTAPQPSDDYLTDTLSLSAHMPSSSTVSPSSLDLGPCPLPKPAMWSIDEVYHYITTRDNSLLEVADKFKHHEIDGQALLLLSMESLRNYLKIKLGPALKVDHLITRLKRGLL